MQRLLKPAILAIALSLGACSYFGGSPGRDILVACQGYASSLTVLAVRKAAGQLTDGQIVLVNRLRPALNSVCIDGDYSDPDAALAIVEEGMFALIQMERYSK